MTEFGHTYSTGKGIFIDGWGLRKGELVDPETGRPLPTERRERVLHSYELFSTLKTSYSALKDPRDRAFADQVIAAWRAAGYE